MIYSHRKRVSALRPCSPTANWSMIFLSFIVGTLFTSAMRHHLPPPPLLKSAITSQIRCRSNSAHLQSRFHWRRLPPPLQLNSSTNLVQDFTLDLGGQQLRVHFCLRHGTNLDHILH